jgi:hypothetical protein
MKRTTISLPDEVALVAEREARRRGVSLSHVARQALEEHLGIGPSGGEPRDVPFAGLGRSGRSDTARRAGQIVRSRWARAISADRG